MTVPHAVPALPTKVYQAKTSLRMAVGVSWASVDSSTARKGPISLPLYSFFSCAHASEYQAAMDVISSYLGLITPNMLAATNTQ